MIRALAMDLSGSAWVPAAVSEPVGATKIPRERSPSNPSQLLSTPAASGMSVVSVTVHSQPSATSPLRSTVSGSHLRNSHTPASQVALAPGNSQAILQPPQWSRLEPISVSHPLLGFPSQSAVLAEQLS